MRLRFDKTAQTKLEESNFYLRNFPIQVFQTDVIEIGAGKGEMIAQLALNNPKVRYFALEKYQTVANKILSKIKQYNLMNLYIITKDAKEIPEIFQGQVKQIWLTFSDPWPKNAHEKRRLTYKTYLDLYKNLLSKDGEIWFKTDNDKLFNYSIESLKANNWIICAKTTDLHHSKYNENNYQTDYEIKWANQNKNINFLIAKYNLKEENGSK
ncbi:tRNA (guanosine(46)-N7)-methyltransferase TrmB [Mycoplasmopsis bovirhinis]|uniref:tRNA (guanine-N(7)-)-methyltransferase n=1 Tax=Mycoplasmopsis bovirhinis TaxID=29553 RepID=A0A449ACH0_9BACT|nr:tRNA (guanosine(46)-N7)-methyltransferase TrmB [Mycoplasmopsis bovirhinis]VEU62603.1 tRNA (guanine-N(7)-)-methyltransferase [Mycoplasmopsis bovirhinis]